MKRPSGKGSIEFLNRRSQVQFLSGAPYDSSGLRSSAQVDLGPARGHARKIQELASAGLDYRLEALTLAIAVLAIGGAK